MVTSDDLAAAGAALTPTARDAIAAKFRTQIGGVYCHVAAAIEHDHPDAS